MDVGAGSFMFANALVGRRRGGRAAKDFFADIGRGARRAAAAVVSRPPRVALAALRAWSAGARGHAVPVNEYGKHWNFFATLAAVMIVVDMAPVPVPGARGGRARARTSGASRPSACGASSPARSTWWSSAPRLARRGDGEAANAARSRTRPWGNGCWRTRAREAFAKAAGKWAFSVPGTRALYFLGVGLGVWFEKWLALDASHGGRRWRASSPSSRRAPRARGSGWSRGQVSGATPKARARAADERGQMRSTCGAPSRPRSGRSTGTQRRRTSAIA